MYRGIVLVEHGDSCAKILQLAVLAVALMWALPANADPALERTAGFFVDVAAGPAYARYAPVDPGSDIPEHNVRWASLLGVGAGYQFGLGFGALDAGVRLSQLRLRLAGSYDSDTRDDEYRANYDFLAPAAATFFETRFGRRVDVYAGLTLGTAVLLSDRQGEAPRSELIPVFGTFEGGLAVHATDWLDVRGGLSWVPPVDQLRMLAPLLTLRVRP